MRRIHSVWQLGVLHEDNRKVSMTKEKSKQEIEWVSKNYHELKLSEKDKEMEQLVSSIKEMHHNSKIVGNLIAEKDKDIERLNRIWEDGVVLLKWKDKEIEQLKQEIVELQHRLVHSDEELTGNSRDFWKAEATKLKSENKNTVKEIKMFMEKLIPFNSPYKTELFKFMEKKYGN